VTPRLRSPTGSVFLPKRNYGYEKRQKELTKQRKKEEKLQRKLERTPPPSEQVDEGEGAAPEQPAGE
jgi:hypothetical protein